MERSEQLTAMAKKHGVVAIAKSVNNNGAFLTETEMTQCIVEHAKRIGSTFEKVYCGTDTDAIELRKAITRCRDDAFLKAGAGLMPLTPVVSAGKDATAVDDPVDALAKLTALSEEMRRRSPGKTSAQAFAEVYSSPEYKELADLERRQSRNRLPVTGGFGSGTLAPLEVDKAASDVGADEDGGEAYQKMMALAEDAHAAQPEQSVAQHFAKIYSSFEHRELAKAERRANRPNLRA